MAVYQGSCHCRRIVFRYATDIQPAKWAVRACQCSFCRRHGAACTSDPDGQVIFTEQQDGEQSWYRFGLQTADFLVCPICGIYVGAVIQTPQGWFATINCHTLDEPPNDLPEETAVRYDNESASERLARRERVWTPMRPFQSISARERQI